ncbi:hypothetical protein Scep_001922 [Stephania cephalantha]|uniref:Pentatricopeptide repeat-containing protein n=1 Tax=Stephania cephalantha TaxID=152367 RepID=A0AAP0L968_9MAGN
MIDGYCKMGELGEASKLLGKMLDNGIAPDVVTYNTLTSGFCKEGRVEEAFKINDQMSRRGIVPDEVSNTTLVDGLSDSPIIEAVYTALKEAEACSTDLLPYWKTELITKCKEMVEAEGERINEEKYVNESNPSILSSCSLAEEDGNINYKEFLAMMTRGVFGTVICDGFGLNVRVVLNVFCSSIAIVIHIGEGLSLQYY